MSARGVQKFKIRNMRMSDWRQLAENYYSRYSELKWNPTLGVPVREKKPSLGFEKKWVGNIFKSIRRGDAIMIVAEVDGRVIGSASLERREDAEDRHSGRFGIHINDGYRSMGVGSALLGTIIKMARKQGYTLLTLTVFDKNRPAIALYKKFGFRKYGLLPRAFIRGKRSFGSMYMYLPLGDR